MHYARWLRHGDPMSTQSPFRSDDERRFLSYIKKLRNGCWEWTAYVNPAGYGKFMAWKSGRPRSEAAQCFLAHRWAFQHWKGPIPKGKELDHECHSRDLSCRGGPGCPHRRCVNPKHLAAKTRSQQSKDSRRWLRDQTRCIQSHAYTQKTLFFYRDGSKGCLRCTPKLPSDARTPVWELVARDPGSRRRLRKQLTSS